MDTKLIGDISEYKVIVELLQKEYNVLKPIGDRLRYDVAFEVNSKLIKIQVKTAYKYSNYYAVDVRMSKTNRKIYKHVYYAVGDFDFLIVRIPYNSDFYIFPIDFVLSKKASIMMSINNDTLVSFQYKNNWNLIEEHIKTQ